MCNADNNGCNAGPPEPLAGCDNCSSELANREKRGFPSVALTNRVSRNEANAAMHTQQIISYSYKDSAYVTIAIAVLVCCNKERDVCLAQRLGNSVLLSKRRIPN